MGNLISNVPINCVYCGYNGVQGKENQSKNYNGDTIVECSWVCPRCFNLVRRDEQIIPKPNETKK